MKRFSLIAAAALVVAVAFTGCTATNDTRTGLRGELCAFGFCLAPSAMAAQAVAVPVTETAGVFGGSVVAPATIVSQPAVATQTQTVTAFAAPAACTPAPNYGPPVFQAPPPRSYVPEK